MKKRTRAEEIAIINAKENSTSLPPKAVAFRRGGFFNNIQGILFRAPISRRVIFLLSDREGSHALAEAVEREKCGIKEPVKLSDDLIARMADALEPFVKKPKKRFLFWRI